jgi:hypothetical protein
MPAHQLPAKQEAMRQGKAHYIGKPCKHGHGGKKYTLKGRCVECARIYYDQWRRIVRR